MTKQYRAVPTYQQPISQGSNTHSEWWRWFQDTENGRPPTAEISVSLTASPMTYTAPRKGNVIVTGGSVSAIHFTRSGTYSTGQTSGVFNLSQGDMLTVTYTGTPTITFVPT
jgi:hypothetical protein